MINFALREITLSTMKNDESKGYLRGGKLVKRASALSSPQALRYCLINVIYWLGGPNSAK